MTLIMWTPLRTMRRWSDVLLQLKMLLDHSQIMLEFILELLSKSKKNKY